MSFPCSVRLMSSGSSASLSTSESFSMLFACRFKIFSFGYCSKTYKQRKTNLLNYYTLDQLWKLWLILSILSIYKRVCRDNPIPAVDIELSCRVQTLSSFQALRPCNVLKLLQAQREESSFAYCLKKMNDFGFSTISCSTLSNHCLMEKQTRRAPSKSKNI